MTFLELKTMLEATLGRDPNDTVYEMVTADINAELRLKDMEATTTLVEAASIALPTLFLEVIDAYVDVDPRRPLLPRGTAGINRSYATSQTSTHYAIVDGFMLLSPSPDSSENIEMRYYEKFADLSVDADTNAVLTTYPSVYIWGALAAHAGLVGDQRIGIWKPAYESAKAAAKKSSIRSKVGGSPNTVVAPGATP